MSDVSSGVMSKVRKSGLRFGKGKRKWSEEIHAKGSYGLYQNKRGNVILDFILFPNNGAKKEKGLYKNQTVRHKRQQIQQEVQRVSNRWLQPDAD